MRVVFALWLRELKRYWRSKLRIATALVQPVLYLLVMGFGLAPVYRRAGAGNFIQFVAPGIISMTVLFASISSGVGFLWDRQFGFLRETLVAPVPRFQIVLGRTCGSATVALFQGMLVAVVCLVAGFRPVSLALVPAGLGFLVLIAILFTALATTLGSSIKDMQGYTAAMNVLVLPSFLLSGTLFPLDNLPALLATLTRLDPLTYGVDGMRSVLIAKSHFSALLDLAVLGSTAAILLGVGIWRFSKIEI
jgi:ABC-2 type transport system permease protein